MDYENYKECVRELYHWTNSPFSSNFMSMLFSLISKADSENRARLAKGFPTAVKVFEDWHNSKNETEFFSQLEVQQ